jgi:hypothetical protein
MTPKTLFIAFLMTFGLTAHAQLEGGAGKMFIIQNSARDVVMSSSDPAAALNSVDRLVVSHAAGKVITVAECTLRICREVPVQQSISLDTLKTLNRMVGARNLTEGLGEGSCRLCEKTTSIPMSFDEYFRSLQAVEESK